MKKGLAWMAACISVAVLFLAVFPARQEAGNEVLMQAAVRKLLPGEDALEESIRVYLSDADEIREMPLEEYVAGVVTAEMPQSYAAEALRAQAIAARTYALKKSPRFGGSGCLRHPKADVCTSSACCQGYEEPAEDSAAARAAQDTAGLVICFRGHLIHAMYHASAGGHTEDCENVYSDAIAYLRGVPSEGEENYKQYASTATFTASQLQSAFSDNDNVQISTEFPLEDQLEVIARSETGRVTAFRAGLGALTGTEVRHALKLRSAMFDMTFSGESVTFSVRGYGHGVGMSQTGADFMAKNGKTAREILEWYYTGVEIVPLSSLTGAA